MSTSNQDRPAPGADGPSGGADQQAAGEARPVGGVEGPARESGGSAGGIDIPAGRVDNPAARAPYKWTFGRASLVILVAVVTGQFLGSTIDGLRATPGPLGLREWILVVVLLGFGLSAATFLVLQREAVTRFFRTMQVGVTLVVLTLFAVMIGVLVPQIDGFEDPTERVPSIADIPDETFYAYLALPDERNQELPRDQQASLQMRADKVLAGLDTDQRNRLHGYRRQYQQFRWAEGYFIYHLMRPYGIGMPEPPPMMPSMAEGLERYELKYGKEERDNREKSMNAALGGRAISQEIGASIRANEKAYRAFFDVSTKLDFNRTYKSHWFATLLALLFAGVFSNTFKGHPSTWLTMRKVGYMTVHVGVMTILIGGAVSKSQTVRGILQMDLREGPKNEFWGWMDPKKPRWMPFWIKLDRFARRDWKALEVTFPEEQFTSNPPQYTLWPGRKVDLDFAPDEKGIQRPRIRLEVLSLHERARALPSGFAESDVDGDPFLIGPLAEIAIAHGHAAGNGAGDVIREEVVHLAPLMRERRVLYDPDGKFRLLVHYGPDLDAAREEARTSDDGRLGWLSMRVGAQGDVEPTVAPIRVGESVRAPGGYTLEIVRAAPNFRLDPESKREIVDERPLSEQVPVNPAVLVRIRSDRDGRVEERPVLERFDYEAAGLQKDFEHGELVINLMWDPWSAPGPERRVLHWDASRTAHLVDPDGEAAAVETGAALPLPGTTRMVPRNLFANARLERRIQLDPDAPVIEGPHFDESFYSTEPTGVRVRVTTNPGRPREDVQEIDLASTRTGFADTWMSPDKRFYLNYFENDRVMPFEWRSVLSVWERDADGRLYKADAGDEKDREIRVNDYFSYRPQGWFSAGYRFFQSNAHPQFPTYSGIGVVYDPGIPIVLLGMYLTIVGTLLRFIVRPIVESYGRRRTPAEAA